MNNESLNPAGEANDSPERYLSALEIKELFEIFRETRADELTVVSAIEDALMEPIPDLEDPSAVQEYNDKMEMLKDLAKEYAARSDLMRTLWEKLESKTQQPQE